MTEGLLGLRGRLHYIAERPTTDSVDFLPGEPSLPGTVHSTGCKPAEEGDKLTDTKSSIAAASLPPVQTNLKVDRISSSYTAVTFEITVEMQTRSIFFPFAAIRSSSCQWS